MERVIAVIDTNVLISALRSRRGASFRLLSFLGDQYFQILLSPALLFEYESVAKRQAHELWAVPEKVEDVLDYLCAISAKPSIAYSWRPHLPDPNDDMVLELAVAGNATHIATHNGSDFRGANQFGITILSPRELLRKFENPP
jgi:putative PIN family toxin of toxin-antitoxin system